ncbi:MAG: hypothetical protein RLZZ522_1163 [Verrucomicrobiota bacterium]
MFTALHIPDFPLVAALRGDAAGELRPAAVLGERSGRKGDAPLLAVNRAARQAGVASGWSLNRALVRCPELRLLAPDPEAEAALLAELVSRAESLTPDLEITAVDTVILDLSLRRERTGRVIESIASGSFEIWQATAPTPDLAQVAVRIERLRGKVVTTADLEYLPVAMLRWLGSCEKNLNLLHLWGLRTIGEFLKLPRQALAERLGAEVASWHDLLHGKTCRTLRLNRPLESFACDHEFEEPAVAVESLLFAMKRLLQTIESQLAARHLAAARLDFRLVLEGGGELRRQLRFSEPQTGVGGMLALVQTALESQQLPAAVLRVEVAASTTFATAAQREWFGRELPQPERWAETLARLEALLGPGRVGIPVPPTSFQPDAFTLRPAAGRMAAEVPNGSNRPDGAVPLRRYRPAREVAVASEWRGERPWPLALLTGPHPGRIVAWRGPFPSSGAWWDPGGAWQRLEWDVQLEDRHLLRLAWQAPERWQLDGRYG